MKNYVSLTCSTSFFFCHRKSTAKPRLVMIFPLRRVSNCALQDADKRTGKNIIRITFQTIISRSLACAMLRISSELFMKKKNCFLCVIHSRRSEELKINLFVSKLRWLYVTHEWMSQLRHTRTAAAAPNECA